MTQAFTTQQHVGTDGVLHLDVPAEWCDTDVEVVVKPVAMPARTAEETVEEPGQTLAEALKDYIGLFSFDVPEDFHERRKEIYAESLAQDYEQKMRERRDSV